MEYKFLKIKYMSGTGNSYRAAIWMYEVAREKGISSELEQITGNIVGVCFSNAWIFSTLVGNPACIKVALGERTVCFCGSDQRGADD